MLSIFAAIYRVVTHLPPAALAELAAQLAAVPNPDLDDSLNRILCVFPNPSFRREVAHLFTVWQTTPAQCRDGSTLAVALQAAAHAHQYERDARSAELVWTGPDTLNLPIRRTEQVILQMIQNCQRDMICISFAIYKVPTVVSALLDFLNRGGQLTLIAETPEAGEGKVRYGLESTFGPAILNRAHVLVWPKAKRPVDAQGRYGSLHVKGIVSDQRNLFITSANLTGYALALNMELGVLLNNPPLAQQLHHQIEDLIQRDILVPLNL